MSFLKTAHTVFENEINALSSLQSQLDDSFDNACELIMNCTGKVVVCGMGKSGHIGNKIAATLASTGSPAFFMHPGEANHGDLGMLSKGDVLIGISNSGETFELNNLLPVVKRVEVPIISITNNPTSTLAKFSDVVLNIHVDQEACSLGLAPTTSTTSTLVLGDALAVALLEAKGFTATDFALSHPGGSLGRRLLLTVDDVMATGDELPLVNEDAKVTDALFEISDKGLGMTGVTNQQGNLLGVFTDGDLRRALDKHIDIHQSLVSELMTHGSITFEKGRLAVDALNTMQDKKINALFVINTENKPVGAVKMHTLLKAGVV
ncbi:KpsF/GutQ family sugar-phosphate isomerase [Glaciecola sp. MH2013]|uniref:KpsF/GutQ family sugar-phosphate isomerase n=1 Tax=Glaciecola sp. MH2013 TaxID=2785524 RepID=UPI00189F4A27|nr:KpsF/GutQ family sugar-phosphate isomerase [Glaciecola sp. MH2013]MBF7074911.1 KpsF/GutQ family sugar-phosphate isomerase [Glaciecola sp. MH2013]